MPIPIPIEEVLDVTVAYLIRRQLQGRPTTLRQLSKRIGLGVPTIRGILEKNQVEYLLMSHTEGGWSSSSTEIAVKTMPEKVARRSSLTQAQVEESYHRIFGKEEPEPMPKPSRRGDNMRKPPKDPVMDAVLNVDPYYPYRIESEEFKQLKDKLINYKTLVKEVRKRGYPGSAVLRAVGGDRMKYELVSPVWRPYIYRNKRFYHIEVLQHLNDLYRTYKKAKTGRKKKIMRRKKFTPKGYLE